MGHYCPPGSGSTDLIKSGSNPDPKHWKLEIKLLVIDMGTGKGKELGYVGKVSILTHRFNLPNLDPNQHQSMVKLLQIRKPLRNQSQLGTIRLRSLVTKVNKILNVHNTSRIRISVEIMRHSYLCLITDTSSKLKKSTPG